jgi:carbon monoxide dehydrogenase subunit G
MKIANEFTVHVPIDTAWKVLTDLEGIAPCLPGAQLTGVDGDVYKGKVKIKVGPVISEFAGTAQFAEKDDTAHRAVIDAKGRDARSAGNASAAIVAQLRPAGDSTVVNVDTDLKISGKLAQFGSGMIKEVSEKLLGQFVVALEAKIAADNPAAAPDGPAPLSAAASTPAASTPAASTDHADAAEPAASDGGASTADALPAASPAPGIATADDAQASADIQLARDEAGTDAPLSETIAQERPGAALLAPGGTAELATVEDAAPVQKTNDAAPVHKEFASTAEPEPLDLMELAGGSIRKRLIPVAIGVVVVVAAIVIWRVAR